MGTMKLNVRLLRRIQRHILAEPKRVNMDDWVTPIRHIKPSRRPPCGTVACIAGWAVELNGGLLSPDPVGTQAARLLALEEPDADQKLQHLFFVSDWPVDLRDRIDLLNPGTVAYAKVVAMRIDRFIDSKGEE